MVPVLLTVQHELRVGAQMTNIREFICENCGETFYSERSDEEAEAEAQFLFGELSEEDKAILCDDCFQKLMAWLKKERLL